MTMEKWHILALQQPHRHSISLIAHVSLWAARAKLYRARAADDKKEWRFTILRMGISPGSVWELSEGSRPEFIRFFNAHRRHARLSQRRIVKMKNCPTD